MESHEYTNFANPLTSGPVHPLVLPYSSKNFSENKIQNKRVMACCKVEKKLYWGNLKKILDKKNWKIEYVKAE